MGQIVSPYHRGVDNLEGIDLDKFLALRIRYHFEILLKVKCNLINASELPEGLTRNQVIYGLTKEIAVNLETLCAYKVSCLIIGFLDRGKPYYEQAIDAHVKNLANKIELLKENDEYYYRSGFEGNPGHYLYIGFFRLKNQIHIRIDNLGDGWCNKHAEEKKKNKQGYMRPAVKPYFVGQFPIFQFSENLKALQYLKNIITAQFEYRQTALPKIYNALSDNLDHAIVAQWPSKKPQQVGNCGGKNHSAGMHFRLNNIDPTGHFYKWLIRKESRETAVKVQAKLAIDQTNSIFSQSNRVFASSSNVPAKSIINDVATIDAAKKTKGCTHVMKQATLSLISLKIRHFLLFHQE